MDECKEFAQRIARLNVEHARILKVWEMLDSMRFNRTLEEDDDTPRNLFLSGPSGVGKTKCMKKYAKKFPGYIETDEDGTEYDIVPVAYMELPNPFTIEEFYQSIFGALGAERTAGQPKVGDVKTRAFELIKKQKVEMLILDEMDYVQTSRAVTPKEAMQTFKHVSNQCNISLVFVGGPETEELVEISFQYFRRFPKIPLEHFTECDEEFCNF